MEFNEKLQELRKQKGLTQEELAQALYVSRTAVSKWESGRGFPSIDSLKSISKYFSVSLDELLTGEEILTIAEADRKEKDCYTRDLVFGLLDCGIALLLFLPFFSQDAGNGIQAASLLTLTQIQPYSKIAFWILVILVTVLGILTLALQNCQFTLWKQSKRIISLILSVIGVCLFIISQQPYAAVFTFAFLIIKALMLLKRR